MLTVCNLHSNLVNKQNRGAGGGKEQQYSNTKRGEEPEDSAFCTITAMYKNQIEKKKCILVLDKAI